ncbi:MAG: ribosome maturation factor RimM [Acholeplasmataceae bacterium]
MHQIGKIVNTHGIKGEVNIYNLSDFNRFVTNETIYVEQPNQTYKALIIERVRPHKNILIVKFKTIDDINDVLPYKGLFVYADKKNEIIEDDEYYYDDLIDKEVYLENNKFVGTVLSVVEVPQGYLLEIKTKDKVALIPFRNEFIISIDDHIVIKDVEGLL